MGDLKKIGVFGGTGFIGSNVVNSLIEFGYEPNVLVRNKHHNKSLKDKGAILFDGDINDVDKVRNVVEKSDVIIYAIGIIREYHKRGITFEKLHFEYFKQIVDIAKEVGTKKIIYISANGVDNLSTQYQSTKYLAEQYLRNNFENWTIFRPSVIYGNPGKKMEFLTQLKKDIIDKSIPVPKFFKGNPFKSNTFFQSNPVYINDLSQIIVKSIDSEYSVNKIHKVGGPDLTTWHSMLKTVNQVLGKKKLFIPVPVILVQLIAKIFDRFSFFPITSSQIKMLKEDNSCDSTELFKHYKITPTRFTKDSLNYLNQ